MNQKQVELTSLIVNEMGETLCQVGEGNEARFYLGSVETPFGDQNFVVITGKEITSFFGASAMMKPTTQIKLDITTFTANTSPIVVKCSANSKWWCYSRL